MKTRLVNSLSLLSLCLFVLHGAAFAQEETSGTIEGTVTDTSGAPLPGVTVTLASSQGPKTRTTGVDGRFMFAQLPAGTYTVKALLEGFNSVERKDVDVRLGARLRMD